MLQVQPWSNFMASHPIWKKLDDGISLHPWLAGKSPTSIFPAINLHIVSGLYQLCLMTPEVMVFDTTFIHADGGTQGGRKWDRTWWPHLALLDWKKRDDTKTKGF